MDIFNVPVIFDQLILAIWFWSIWRKLKCSIKTDKPFSYFQILEYESTLKDKRDLHFIIWTGQIQCQFGLGSALGRKLDQS